MTTNRRTYVSRNIIISLTSKLLTIVLSFVSRTVFIWGFGIEFLGINGLFSDVLSFLSLADLGFGVAMVYSFYEPLATNNKEKLSALVNYYKQIYRIIAMIVFVVGCLLIPLLPYIINLEKNIPNLYLYYFISLFSVIASYLYVYKTSILTADQKNYIIVKISMVLNVIKTIVQIFLIVLFKNYFLYLLVNCLFVVINNLYASKQADKEYSFINNDCKLDNNDRKNITGNLFSAFIIKFASVILNATDNIIISIVVGTVAVGYYSNYIMIQNNIMSFYVLLFASLTASLGNLIITENEEKRHKIFACSQTVAYVATSVIVPCFVTLVNCFVGIWLGSDYEFDMIVVVAMGINIYFSCVLQPLWTYREATGLYKKTKWAMIVCAIFNIVFSVVGGNLLGIAGIIFATSLSRLLTYVWYEPMILYKLYFNASVKTYFWGILKNFIFVIILSFISLFLLNVLEIESIISWLVFAIILFLSLLLFTIWFYRKNESLREIMKYATGLFEKNR